MASRCRQISSTVSCRLRRVRVVALLPAAAQVARLAVEGRRRHDDIGAPVRRLHPLDVQRELRAPGVGQLLQHQALRPVVPQQLGQDGRGLGGPALHQDLAHLARQEQGEGLAEGRRPGVFLRRGAAIRIDAGQHLQQHARLTAGQGEHAVGGDAKARKLPGRRAGQQVDAVASEQAWQVPAPERASRVRLRGIPAGGVRAAPA